jgi:hypothetical protein
VSHALRASSVGKKPRILEGIVGWSEFDEGFGSPGVSVVIERLAARVVDWVVQHYDAPLAIATGVIPASEPAVSFRAFAAAVGKRRRLLVRTRRHHPRAPSERRRPSPLPAETDAATASLRRPFIMTGPGHTLAHPAAP